MQRACEGHQLVIFAAPCPPPPSLPLCASSSQGGIQSALLGKASRLWPHTHHRHHTLSSHSPFLCSNQGGIQSALLGKAAEKTMARIDGVLSALRADAGDDGPLVQVRSLAALGSPAVPRLPPLPLPAAAAAAWEMSHAVDTLPYPPSLLPPSL